MGIMHLCNVSFSSCHYDYQSTMELFYSEVTVHDSICFKIKQYLHFIWGNVILDHAQSQGPHRWSTSVSACAAPSDVVSFLAEDPARADFIQHAQPPQPAE